MVGFIDHRDIPGMNNCMTEEPVEEIFSSGDIHYAGQAIGLILAHNSLIAHQAASLVRVEYKNLQKPIIGIHAALNEKG